MDAVTRARELRGRRATLPEPVGLVPTMGALHAGHAALVARARAECTSVIVSVFINPLQFGPNEDFNAYPRALDDDRRQLESLGVDLLFMPDVAEMYPRQLDVFVEPTSLARAFEGERRPGHFRGVATGVNITAGQTAAVTIGGQLAGRVTSARYSPVNRKAIGLAWVPAASAGEGSEFSVRVNGRYATARVTAQAFYDAEGARLRM